MKKKTFEFAEIGKKFQNEKIDRYRMNFLMGGDDDGGQGGSGPWEGP